MTDEEQLAIREEALASTTEKLKQAVEARNCLGYVFAAFYIEEGGDGMMLELSHVFPNDMEAAKMMATGAHIIQTSPIEADEDIVTH